MSSTVPSPSSALLASSTAFRFSSVPLFTLSSQPPPVYHAAAQFDFDMPATFTMSMTLPNTLQLPALTDQRGWGANADSTADIGGLQQVERSTRRRRAATVLVVRVFVPRHYQLSCSIAAFD